MASFSDALSSFVRAVRAYNARGARPVAAEVVHTASGACLLLQRRWVLAWSHAYASPELYCLFSCGGACSVVESIADCADADCAPRPEQAPGDAWLLDQVSSCFGAEGALRVAECPAGGQPSVCVNACGARAAVSEMLGDACTTTADGGVSVRHLAAFLSLYGPSVGLFLPADLHLWLCGR